MYRIVNSHYGYASRGIHDNEKRMQASGYNTWLYKYTAWIIAGGLRRGGRCPVRLLRQRHGSRQPGHGTSDISFLIVILGSAPRSSVRSSASVVYVGVEYLASLYLPERWPLIFGAMFVFTIMVDPARVGRAGILKYGGG